MPGFEEALRFVLAREGGYVDDPADPGGATNRGITQGKYDAYRHRIGQTPRPVRQLTDTELRAIYGWIWQSSGAAALPWPLALAHFDAAVNHGDDVANRLLHSSARDTTRYLSAREALFRDIAARRPASQKFLGGWLTRLDHVRRAVLQTSALPGARVLARAHPAPANVTLAQLALAVLVGLAAWWWAHR